VTEDQIEEFGQWADENSAGDKPIVELPGGSVSISDCAAKDLFRALLHRRKTFVYARVAPQWRYTNGDDGLFALDIMRPAAARSFFEKFGRLMVWRCGAEGQKVLKPTTCPQEAADALLQTEGKRARCSRGWTASSTGPIIRVVNGAAGCHVRLDTTLSHVYSSQVDRELRTWTWTSATEALLGLLQDFEFQSDGDKARAMARSAFAWG